MVIKVGMWRCVRLKPFFLCLQILVWKQIHTSNNVIWIWAIYIYIHTISKHYECNVNRFLQISLFALCWIKALSICFFPSWLFPPETSPPLPFDIWGPCHRNHTWQHKYHPWAPNWRSTWHHQQASTRSTFAHQLTIKEDTDAPSFLWRLLW